MGSRRREDNTVRNVAGITTAGVLVGAAAYGIYKWFSSGDDNNDGPPPRPGGHRNRSNQQRYRNDGNEECRPPPPGGHRNRSNQQRYRNDGDDDDDWRPPPPGRNRNFGQRNRSNQHHNRNESNSVSGTAELLSNMDINRRQESGSSGHRFPRTNSDDEEYPEFVFRSGTRGRSRGTAGNQQFIRSVSDRDVFDDHQPRRINNNLHGQRNRPPPTSNIYRGRGRNYRGGPRGQSRRFRNDRNDATASHTELQWPTTNDEPSSFGPSAPSSSLFNSNLSTNSNVPDRNKVHDAGSSDCDDCHSRSNVKKTEAGSSSQNIPFRPEKDKECSICLEDMNITFEVAYLPCGHAFHRKCIKDWIKTSNLCANCRHPLGVADLTYIKTLI